MTVLKSTISTRSEAYRENQAAMAALVADLEAKVEEVKQGGGEQARDKHLARGKLLPRERVRTLLDEVRESGEHTAVWNGRDDAGRIMAAGTYFCRLQAGGEVQIRRMVLVK